MLPAALDVVADGPVKLVQTGGMEMHERGARVREVRRRLAQDGPPWTRHHERDFETVTMPNGTAICFEIS